MKGLIIPAALLLIVTIASGMYAYYNLQKLGEAENAVKEVVGKHLIVDKDTLMIVDYSLMDQTFSLSDGRKVSFKLVTDKTLLP
jgi:hypothetical protein